MLHGEHKGIPVIRIRFVSVGVKHLSTEVAIPLLSPAPEALR